MDFLGLTSFTQVHLIARPGSGVSATQDRETTQVAGYFVVISQKQSKDGLPVKVLKSIPFTSEEPLRRILPTALVNAPVLSLVLILFAFSGGMPVVE